MATPSLAMIPSAYADSKVYSVLPNNGDGDFTFNRDSSATRVGQNGLIQTVGYFGNNLVTNGDFATDTDWSKGAGWTISGGSANSDGTGLNSITQLVSLPTGTLRIKFEVTARTQGNVRLFINKPAFSELFSADAVGSYEVDVVTTSGANNVYFYSTNNFIGSIDNVSVQEVTGDQPRLNYDISNGQVQSCPSLLLEGASTNFVTYSESMNQYTVVNGTITPNALTSPDGTLNAVKFSENSSNSQHVFDTNTISVTSGTKYTISVFAKYSGRFLTLQGSSPLGGAFAIFNLQNGTVSQQGVGTASIEEMSNDWYRCKLVVQMVSTANCVASVLLNDSATGGRSRSYQGDGSSGVYLYGFQTEQGSYATSYIPTNGSSQTRAAETCFGAGTSSTFNDSEGVLYAEISALADGTNQRWISIGSGSNANRVSILFNVPNKISCSVRGSSSAIYDANFDIGSQTNNTKAAIRYKNSDFAFFVNGVKVDSQQSGSLSFNASLSELAFDSADGSSDFYGNTKDIRVYNEALTDAQLQTLTTL